MADTKPHAKSGFERQDLTAGTVIAFMVTLVILAAGANVVIHFMYDFMDHYMAKHQDTGSPLVAHRSETRETLPSDIQNFPQPRLETNERMEINEFRLHEEQQLHSYGYVDQSAGELHIPIDRAMELIAQRGLPTIPKAGVEPESEIHVVRIAAEKSDTSGMAAPKKATPRQ